MARSTRFEELSLKEAPKIIVTPPGPRSMEILKMQEELEGSAVSYPRGMPMALERGRGATLEDADGNIFIDCFSGAGVMALGHAHPEVLKAAHEQLDKVTHTLDIPSATRMKLVKAMHRILPKELSRVFFGGPTGSDAIEQAVKLAKFNTGRYGIIAFEGAYHGMTSTALALTSDSGHKDGLGPLVPGVQFIPFPYRYRNPFGCPKEMVDEFAADKLERVLSDSHSGYSKPAAVILEAVQGEGGTIIPTPIFLQRVREITKAHGVLLICDEIQAGLGRTGKMFSFEHSGIVPDIITISKALGGIGFPISAIAYREELNTMPPGKSIGTFRGNRVAFAAVAAALDWMVENKVPEYAAELGEKVMKRFRDIERNSNILGEARGIGLMVALEIVEDSETRKPAPELTRQVRKLAHQRGVMIEVGGHYNNVARLLPPLIISEDLMMKAVDILEGVLKDLE